MQGLRRGSDGEPLMRPRSHTITLSSDISEKKLPTVFRWEGTAQQVLIVCSIDNFKSRTPMIKRHVYIEHEIHSVRTRM
jgi:hypothetical protein